MKNSMVLDSNVNNIITSYVITSTATNYTTMSYSDYTTISRNICTSNIVPKPTGRRAAIAATKEKYTKEIQHE